MKKTTLFIALTILFALPAFSQSGKNEKIKHLISLMQVDTMLDQTFEQMAASSAKQIKAMKIDDEASQKIVSEKMEQQMAVSRRMAKLLVNDLSDIYSKYYTEEDVDVLIKFYESPTGQKTIEMQPKLTGEMMNLLTTKYMPQMQKEMDAAMNDHDHHHH